MHQHRRRKKRPNYSTRSVDIARGFNGFGFTISGQQPCILSCIVENSPADLAGLRTGDFLISVNGMNVYKLPHEAIVELIGSTTGTIRVAIAENYYLDSSDEDATMLSQQQKHQSRTRPKFSHLKAKGASTQLHHHHHHHQQPQRSNHQVSILQPVSPSNHLKSPEKLFYPGFAPNVIPTTSRAIFPESPTSEAGAVGVSSPSLPETPNRHHQDLEYCAIVGYLGTIEMPTQIATSSKLQTVRSCIRKIRQEKRSPNIVLMTILPTCMTLRDKAKVLLAKYPSSRLSFVSNNSDNDNRFFGLVTTVIYADGQMCDAPDKIPHRNDVIISNSCHVFVVDPKLADHAKHTEKASLFQITCTQDPISNSCLEFPNSSEYVVNLIRNMYNLKCAQPAPGKSPVARNLNPDSPSRRNGHLDGGVLEANSPQPSNHSEVTTTSSNSDSGIGFHNDCTNISDRILVVDFPVLPLRIAGQQRGLLDHFPDGAGLRPLAISNDDCLGDIESGRHLQRQQPIGGNPSHHFKSKSMSDQVDTRQDVRLHVRAMPDLQQLRKTVEDYTPDTAVAFGGGRQSLGQFAVRNRGLAARSCDNMLQSVDNEMLSHRAAASKVNCSIENISTFVAPNDPTKQQQHVFVLPKPVKKPRSSESRIRHRSEDALLLRRQPPNGSPFSTPVKSGVMSNMLHKLSPKVFNVSQSVEDLTMHKKKSCKLAHGDSISSSLQDLCAGVVPVFVPHLSSTCSEPDLGNRVIQSNGESPFRRWTQSSFRSRQNEHVRDYSQRRASSTEGEFYSTSMADDTKPENANPASIPDIPKGPRSWGTSFERLLDDPAGLHAFSEFLKKEFSGENIYFWTACERYRLQEDIDRQKEAEAIFEKHLAVGAPEPVNVDSQARTTAQANLPTANSHLFIQTQKQIFNLMKFDSYQRFIRSDLYKRCLDAEINHLPMPYPGDQLDPVLQTGVKSPVSTPKLKKSLSNAEDRRRKSLLPWHRKTRYNKSKDGSSDDHLTIKSLLFASTSSIPKALTESTLNGNSEITSSRSSLSSFDAAFNQRSNNETDESKRGLCRVILSDGATTIVPTRSNEKISEMVERLLDKRGIHYRAFEAFQSGCNKPLALDSDSISIAGKEVTIEQRIVFKLDLPNRKVISVKSKTTKQLEDVLRPILSRYNYRLDLVRVLSKESADPIDLSQSVMVTDGQRLQVVLNTLESLNESPPTTPTKVPKPVRPALPAYINQLNQVLANPSLQRRPFNLHHPSSTHRDELTNKVFNELLQEKVELQTVVHTNNNATTNPTTDRNSLESGSMRPVDWDTDSGSSLFDRQRLNNAKKMEFLGQPVIDTSVESEELGDGRKPLNAKWKAVGGKSQMTHKSENHELLEGLKRAQRSRIEDQRGTDINYELPDFLKNKENYNKNKVRKLKTLEPVPLARSKFDQDINMSQTTHQDPPTAPLRPQPAPRLSIAKHPNLSNTSQPQPPINQSRLSDQTDQSFNSTTSTGNGFPESPTSSYSDNTEHLPPVPSLPLEYAPDPAFTSNGIEPLRGPPPLPPKPKVLPIKPSNWGGGHSSSAAANVSGGSTKSVPTTPVSPVKEAPSHCVPYLEEPKSSFV